MKYFLFILCFSVFTGFSQSTSSLLERRVTLHQTDEIPALLNQISKAGGFSFSYNPSIVTSGARFEISADNKSVREILLELFKGSVDFREKGNHIILTKARPQEPSTVVLSGYIEDAVTHQRLTDASVYDKRSITSVVTDEAGFFRIRVVQAKDLSVAVSKKNYVDTTVSITSAGYKYAVIALRRLKIDTITQAPVVAKFDSVHEEVPMPYLEEPNVANIRDTLYRDIQISLVPFVGSNGRLSGNVINNVSINFIGGYSLGTRQIELGFLVNMDRGDVSFLQIAGIGNLTGGNMYGVQGAGFLNLNGGEVKAAQLTAGSNINFGDFQGVQLAAGANINLKRAQGVQVAGITNITRHDATGVQVAGISNIQTGAYHGSQFSGLSNISTRRLHGSQIAGLFNYGRNVTGTQIGLINYADTLGGIPVGLLSFVGHGYHKLEISADEIFYTNLAFRTGVRKFYNILFTGIKPNQRPSDPMVWTFGYGIGTARRIFPWLYLNLDLTSQHISKGSFTSELSLLNRAHAGLDVQLSRHLSIYGGVTINGYLTRPGYLDYPSIFTDYHPAIIHDELINTNLRMQMWWGARIGVRFL